MGQKIINIEISNLHLWTENPRDKVDINSTDKDIFLRAIRENPKKWNLNKLIIQMGNYYDKSELPTVVIKNNKYIVYDGNRRIAIIKYAKNPCWSNNIKGKIFSKNIPEAFKELKTIPCNVCDEETALTNIERKHVDNGSWGRLERDRFLHVNSNKPKSNLLVIEDKNPGFISQNKKMNQRFVGEEIFSNTNLEEMGFKIENDKFLTIYDKETTRLILDKILILVTENKITTRGTNRGKLLEPFKEHNPSIEIKTFSKKKSKKFSDNNSYSSENKQQPVTRHKETQFTFFGKKLSLEPGTVNNLYRDIGYLYKYYNKNKDKLSESFHKIIGMSLRLLVESACEKENHKITDYSSKYFVEAKKKLNQDEKAFLSSQSIEEDTITKLLHIGAHNYKLASNIEQTKAMSIIIGVMLELSHGKNK